MSEEKKTAKAAANEDVAKMSYEQARDELIKVVAELEQGSVSLETSLSLWERGEALANQCEAWLTGARKRLDDAIKTKKADA
jgi:exodeoxyribonuclease VII small subunit